MGTQFQISGTLSLETPCCTATAKPTLLFAGSLYSRTSDVLQDVPGTTFNLESGKAYRITAKWYSTTNGAAQNHKFKFNGFTADNYVVSCVAYPSANNQSTDSRPMLFTSTEPNGVFSTTAANTFNYVYHYEAIVTMDESATVALQFAQNTTDTDNASTIDSVAIVVQELQAEMT